MVGAVGFYVFKGASLQHPALSALSLGGDSSDSAGGPAAERAFIVPKLPARVIGRAWVADGDKAVLVRPDRSRLELTLVPAVQSAIEARLARSKVPFGGVVLMEPSTGAIRAWVGRRQRGKAAGRGQGLVRAVAPTASVAKVITAAALLEAGVHPDHKTCFHGGTRRLRKSHLEPGPRDNICESLTQSLANSSNAAFGRLAVTRLKPGDLQAKAEDLLFQTLLDFDIAVQPSRFTEGRSRLVRAQTAAGFRGARISPLHAAMLASAVANDGVMMRPYLVAADSLQPGLSRKPAILQRALSARTAGVLRQMLAHTVSDGTASKAFARWPESLQTIDAGGKTGTLARRGGGNYRLYTWFIGFAPVDKPEIAVAVLAVNGRAWRAKAAGIARDALAAWFMHKNGTLHAGIPSRESAAESDAEHSTEPQQPSP